MRASETQTTDQPISREQFEMEFLSCVGGTLPNPAPTCFPMARADPTETGRLVGPRAIARSQKLVADWLKPFFLPPKKKQKKIRGAFAHHPLPCAGAPHTRLAAPRVRRVTTVSGARARALTSRPAGRRALADL